MNICTWLEKGVRCEEQAEYPQHDRARREWANLCGSHAAKLTDAILSPDLRNLLAAWVKASGGAKKLAGSM